MTPLFHRHLAVTNAAVPNLDLYYIATQAIKRLPELTLSPALTHQFRVEYPHADTTLSVRLDSYNHRLFSTDISITTAHGTVHTRVYHMPHRMNNGNSTAAEPL